MLNTPKLYKNLPKDLIILQDRYLRQEIARQDYNQRVESWLIRSGLNWEGLELLPSMIEMVKKNTNITDRALYLDLEEIFGKYTDYLVSRSNLPEVEKVLCWNLPILKVVVPRILPGYSIEQQASIIRGLRNKWRKKAAGPRIDPPQIYFQLDKQPEKIEKIRNDLAEIIDKQKKKVTKRIERHHRNTDRVRKSGANRQDKSIKTDVTPMLNKLSNDVSNQVSEKEITLDADIAEITERLRKRRFQAFSIEEKPSDQISAITNDQQKIKSEHDEDNFEDTLSDRSGAIAESSKPVGVRTAVNGSYDADKVIRNLRKKNDVAKAENGIDKINLDKGSVS